MNRNINSHKSFSLLELLVVIFIIAIVAGIAIPVFYNMRPAILINGAARQIMGDLMWARMRAISENNNYIIVFGKAGPDLANNTYYIYDDDENDFNSAAIDADELVKTVVLPDRYNEVGYGYVAGINKNNNSTPLTGNAVKFGSTGTAARPIWFSFRPTGRPNLAGSIYLILDMDLTKSEKGRMRVLTVSIAGRVKIWKYDDGIGEWE